MFNILRLIKSNNFLKILQLLYYTRLIAGKIVDEYGQLQPTAYILATPLQGNNSVSNDSYTFSNNQVQPNFVYQPSMPLSPYNYYYNTESPPHYTAMADESMRYPSYYQPEHRSTKSIKKKKKKSFKGSSSSYYRPLSGGVSWKVKKRRQSTPSYYKRHYKEQENEDEEEDDIDNEEELNNSEYSNNDYKASKASRHKYKKGKESHHHSTADTDYPEIEDNLLGFRDSINSILDYPDIDLGLGDTTDDLLFGDYEDEVQEETFLRPSIVGLHNGLKLGGAGLGGLSGIHGIGPGLGLGLGGALTGLLGSSFRTFGIKRFMRNGIRLFIALLLLPLLLLFVPIPIVSSNTNTSSRDKHGDGSSESGNGSQLAELSRKVLSSENCLERISCEINHFNEILGMESENYIFARFMSLVYNFDNLFPSFLVRIAHGYLHNSQDNKCSRFNCQSLQSHLPE